MKIENNMRIEREKKRMTQSDLADAIGTSKQTINKIENGKQDCKVSMAIKIANFFELELQDLFQPKKAINAKTIANE